MTQADTFEGVLRWFKQIRDCKSDDCPIIILGNKCDLEHEVIITENELNEVSHLCGIETFQTSAVSAKNVETAFMSIIWQAYNFKIKNVPRQGDVDLNQNKQKKKCCF